MCGHYYHYPRNLAGSNFSTCAQKVSTEFSKLWFPEGNTSPASRRWFRSCISPETNCDVPKGVLQGHRDTAWLTCPHRVRRAARGKRRAGKPVEPQGSRPGARTGGAWPRLTTTGRARSSFSARHGQTYPSPLLRPRC